MAASLGTIRTMNRTTLALAALLAALPAAAQQTQETEDLSALLKSTVAARALVSTAVDECTSRYAELVDPALDAKMEWEARNTPIEERARDLAGRMGAKYAASTSFLGYEVKRKALLAETEAETVLRAKETVTRNLEARPVPERIGVCRDLLKSVHDGKMDFAVTQPNAYKILQSNR
ncbi:hypothetical protein BWI17_10170 [Betaproteobacteria bacterium GR16-43]|nr:hypothetical protein BWI17_10170 [Betaproteobacteria bacterium GR16-43]